MVNKLAVGIVLERVEDIAEALALSRTTGFDYICSKVVEPEVTELLLKSDGETVETPFSFSDLSLVSADWSHSYVGHISELNSHLASDDRILRRKAANLIKYEIDYCMHLNAPAVMIEADSKNPSNMAEILHGKLTDYMNSVWIRIPMIMEDMCNGWDSNDIASSSERSGWYTWTAFHAQCDYEKRIGVSLEMSVNVPSDDEVMRWLGEPIKSVIIPTDVFVQNTKGYPVLTKLHQQLLLRLFTITSQVLIKPTGPLKEEHKFYRQYIDFLFKKFEEANVEDSWVAGYEDYLQFPLQPLMNNLESQIYEIFEKDPVKYVLYQDAIAAAIMSKQPEETSEKLVVMVLGAGRGPIVRAAIEASKKTNRPIILYAVEKNRNAVNTLMHLQRSSWKDLGFDVNVIHSDMRKFNPPVKGDIIVSELLGSFGDNELSPECLDGAQHYLQSDGIMIPQQYASYVHPIMSAKLHNKVKSLPETNAKIDGARCQTPYVVHMKNKYDIAPPKKLFEYHHPNRIPNDTNDRCQQLDFEAKTDCVLSGFAGYFESELYGGILMSILPSSFTEGMFSWFPIYFPIKTPIQVKKGDKISVRFRRCSTERSVWYEWNLISPVALSTHNLNGCAYEIGL